MRKFLIFFILLTIVITGLLVSLANAAPDYDYYPDVTYANCDWIVFEWSDYPYREDEMYHSQAFAWFEFDTYSTDPFEVTFYGCSLGNCLWYEHPEFPTPLPYMVQGYVQVGGDINFIQERVRVECYSALPIIFKSSCGIDNCYVP